MVTKYLKTENPLTFHRVDVAGNYFINGRCANPLSSSDDKIGSNVPKGEWREILTNVAENIWNS